MSGALRIVCKAIQVASLEIAFNNIIYLMFYLLAEILKEHRGKNWQITHLLIFCDDSAFVDIGSSQCFSFGTSSMKYNSNH